MTYVRNVNCNKPDILLKILTEQTPFQDFSSHSSGQDIPRRL
jgi:hypothetical protein